MSKPFSIQHEWLHTEQAPNPEKAAQAEISIWVEEVCLTENMDRIHEAQRHSARLSALHLSRWFAANWWRLFWEPYDARATQEWRTSHRIGAAGGGYLWPNISFSSDWNTMLVRSTSTMPLPAEPVHYLRECNHFIPADSFQKEIEDFVNSTVERLRYSAPGYRELGGLWEEVTKEKNDPEYTEWRKLEASLGYETDEAPSELMENLFAEYDRYGATAIQELAAHSKNNSLWHLHAVTEDIQDRGTPMQVPQHDDIRGILPNQTENHEELPWQRATRTARNARDAWGLPEGPVTNEKLSEIFGIRLTNQPHEALGNTQRLPFHAGIRNEGTSDRFLISLDQRHINSRRFTLARLAADCLNIQGNEQLLPATRASTSRQKFQRAFAQEFLCPTEDLMDFLEGTPMGDDDINEAAAYFEVSPLTIKTTLVNKGYLEREQVFGEWAV
jgi:hypothetical protein